MNEVFKAFLLFFGFILFVEANACMLAFLTGRSKFAKLVGVLLAIVNGLFLLLLLFELSE